MCICARMYVCMSDIVEFLFKMNIRVYAGVYVIGHILNTLQEINLPMIEIPIVFNPKFMVVDSNHSCIPHTPAIVSKF